MSEENKQTEPVQTPPAVAPKSFVKDNFVLIVALVGVLILGVFFINQPRGTINAVSGLSSTPAKYAVLDMSKIMDIAMKQILEDKSLSSEQVSAVGTKLGESIKKLLGEYQAQGYLVFNAKSLATYPPEYDVTAKFSERLGLKSKPE